MKTTSYYSVLFALCLLGIYDHAHAMKHQNGNENESSRSARVLCIHCLNEYKQSSLASHYFRKHLQCIKCPDTDFNNQDDLLEHFETKHKEKYRSAQSWSSARTQCPYCSKSILCRSLERHYQTKHNKCSQCSNQPQFKTETLLLRHLKRTHCKAYKAVSGLIKKSNKKKLTQHAHRLPKQNKQTKEQQAPHEEDSPSITLLNYLSPPPESPNGSIDDLIRELDKQNSAWIDGL